jgi:ATP-binding cassette subfamily B protein
MDLFCALMLSVVDLVFPILSRTFIDVYIPNKNFSMMVTFSWILLALVALRTLCEFFMAYWGHVMGSKMEYDMRNDLFSHLQTLSHSFFDENKTGQLMQRLMGDLNEVSELAHHGPEDLFISLLMTVGSFWILFTINVPLTLILLALMVILVVYTIWMRKHMMETFRKVRKETASVNSRIESALSGIRLCKAFANEQFEKLRFKKDNYAHMDSRKNAFKSIGYFTAGSGFFSDIMSVVIMLLGGFFVISGDITPGELVAYILYTTYFMRPIRRLVSFMQQFQQGVSGFERFIEIMAIQPSIVDHENAVALSDMKGQVVFNKVTFRYEAHLEPVLSDFSLTIDKGKTVALVGPSGVGKSTIAQLIPRFYEVESGAIEIDGLPVTQLTLSSLRSQIGMVQQDVLIFHGSLFENIVYGRPGASLEEVITASKHAHIHDFIMGLEAGYDTFVGEKGVKLSGGQKQRIAIARVFLKNPPILILDEATSALDNETEAAIQQAIETLTVDRTTLIIAHRLSTIQRADEIIVLGEEGIMERGSHEALHAQNGLYAKLYNSQFKGYIPDQVTVRSEAENS